MADKDGLVFVFSMENEASLDSLAPFFELHLQMNRGRKIPVVLAANKKDKVEDDAKKLANIREKGQARAKEIGAIYIETSAATGEKIQDVFESLVRDVRKTKVTPQKKGSGCIIC